MGRYRLLHRLGEGGMGVVHLAEADGHRVALKVLRPHVVGDDEARQRLAREVNSLSRVRSPRVAEIIYQQYQSDLQRRITLGEDPATADAEVRAAMAGHTIGDRVVAGGVGSAPTAREVQQFLRECFDIAFSNGYSSTEGSR